MNTNKLQQYDIYNSRKESTVNSSTLSRNTRESTYNPLQTSHNSVEACVNCSSLYSCTNSAQISEALTVEELGQQIIQNRGVSVTTSTFRASMVQREHAPIQLNRETDKSYISRNINNIRCSRRPSQGLGCPLSGDTHMGSLVSTGKEADPTMFHRVCQTLGEPQMDLFASQASHQLPWYMSRQAEPASKARNALQQNWDHMHPYAFPPFNITGQTLRNDFFFFFFCFFKTETELVFCIVWRQTSLNL